MEDNYKQICKKCRSRNVARLKWVNPNTDEIYNNVYAGIDTEWCMDCRDETTIIDVQITIPPREPPPEGSSWLSFEEYRVWKKWEAQAMARMFPALAKFQADVLNSSLKITNEKEDKDGTTKHDS